MPSPIKAKIVDLTYDKENNLFQLFLQDKKNGKSAAIAVKGLDWGIPKDCPDEVIEQFRKEMIGKEKNIFIEVDNSSIKDVERNKDDEISQDGLSELNDNLDKYPIEEIMNIERKQSKNNEN